MSEGAPLSSLPKDGQAQPGKSLVPATTDLKELLREISPETIKTIPPEVLEKLKETKAILVRERHTSTQLSVTRSSPLPPPSELASYNEIIPQGADRIMKMAEAQSSHRIEIEKKVILSQQGQESKGQFFGFVIGLVGLLCGSYTAISGQPIAGAVIGGVPLAGLVSVFLYSKHKDSSGREEKREEMDSVAPQPDQPPEKHKKHNKRKR
jgi:uncharacterized membrane protein